MIDAFIKSLGISHAALSGLGPLIEKKTVARGDRIAKTNREDHHIVLILKGCLRSFEQTATGRLHSCEFFMKNDLIIGPLSVLDAVENSMLLIGGPEFIRQAIAMYPECMTVCMDKLEQRIRSMQKHLFDLTHLTTEKRYLNFLDSFPFMATRLPQHMIAQYLGMTPESLSRTRKKIRRR